jgi:hypothetical protein
MQAIADALVLAVTYINCRPFDAYETQLHDDVGTLDKIAAMLRAATAAEQDTVAAAAERAMAAEQASSSPRPEFIDDYSRWMETMLGEGWSGNCRAKPKKR